MKFTAVIALGFSAVYLTACGKAESVAAHRVSENVGITYREGRGLAVSAQTQSAIGLETTEAEESLISPRLVKSANLLADNPLFPLDNGRRGQLALSLSREEAALVKVGQTVSLKGTSITGLVSFISDPNPLLDGERDAVVELEHANLNDIPKEMYLAINLPPHSAPAIVPKSAVLKTSSGSFVYVPNENYFFRTAVTVGTENEENVEIVEGLYPGDRVVTRPVTTLWLAELQAIKGGIGCADGH